LALELAAHKIWVNAIAPGDIQTPGVESVQAAGTSPEAADTKKASEVFMARIPMHRTGDPDEIGTVAPFLASELSPYMTGSQIVVEGGVLLSYTPYIYSARFYSVPKNKCCQNPHIFTRLHFAIIGISEKDNRGGTMEQKITPNLWFDGNAKEAVDFYVSAFSDSSVVFTSYYPKTTREGLADFQQNLAGKELTIDFEIGKQRFTTINAGPEFQFNPSVSFMLNFDPSHDEQARGHLDELWGKLVDGGEALMPLDAYPFSKRYGWVKDRYGLTWQLILANTDGEPRPFVVPSLLFAGENTNHAEEAINFYLSVFKEARQGTLARYSEDTGPAKAGSLMYADFALAGQWFAAMDSGVEQPHTFNEAVSFAVACKDQAEIDYFWGKLSTVPESEQCGWCKDKYGVSWQIVPENMGELMKKPGAYTKMMLMKKLVIADF
jgi:predicted 3-demethylubiquinone-9 3-methyltransferase (glyoxalase superfamily)